MKAIELYRNDRAGDEGMRRIGDRRGYYSALRRQMKAELSQGAPCELLLHFAERLEAGQLPHMYLLDAMAVMECYEAVIDGVRFPRDIGVGLPPLAEGGRMSWSEVQRLAEADALPLAEVDAELADRLRGLETCIRSAGEKKSWPDIPRVNRNARLKLVSPAQFAARQTPAPRQPAAFPRTNASQPVGNASPILTGSAASPTDVHIAHLILENLLDEAMAALGNEQTALQEKLAELGRAQEQLAEMQKQRQETDGQLDEAMTRLKALQEQQPALGQELAETREALERTQQELQLLCDDKRQAQTELDEAKERLARENEALRELQRRLWDTQAAAELTHRQAERLS